MSWEGYDASQDSWVPEANIIDSAWDKINAYYNSADGISKARSPAYLEELERRSTGTHHNAPLPTPIKDKESAQRPPPAAPAPPRPTAWDLAHDPNAQPRVAPATTDPLAWDHILDPNPTSFLQRMDGRIPAFTLPTTMPPADTQGDDLVKLLLPMITAMHVDSRKLMAVPSYTHWETEQTERWRTATSQFAVHLCAAIDAWKANPTTEETRLGLLQAVIELHGLPAHIMYPIFRIKPPIREPILVFDAGWL